MKNSSGFKPANGFKPGNAGKPKGATNHMTRDLKDMILGALESAGGETYLADRAVDSPAAFMALVGKCLPKDLNVTAKISLADMIREARARIDAKR